MMSGDKMSSRLPFSIYTLVLMKLNLTFFPQAKEPVSGPSVFPSPSIPPETWRRNRKANITAKERSVILQPFCL